MTLTEDFISLWIGNKDHQGYGSASPKSSFKDIFYSSISDSIDSSRVFFLDTLQYSSYVKIIQISSLHIYLTYPFVLSWSLLEAMSCGALIIGSNTDPVTEVIHDNINGLLVDFFNSNKLADVVSKVLKSPEEFSHLRVNARKTMIQNYDLDSVCLPSHVDLIKRALK